jgi:ribosome recycling factor
MPTYNKSDLERRMHGAVESLKHDLQGLRTGRASTTLLDPVNVEVYGAHMPLNQVATVSAPEPRMLSVQVWDKSNVRKELAKLASQYAEKARIAVRNVRRDGNDALKADEKKHEISEDERKRHETEVQKLTDATIAEIDAATAAKEKEILGK